MNISQPMVKEKNIDFSFRINHFDHEHLYGDQLRLNQIYITFVRSSWGAQGRSRVKVWPFWE